MKHVMKVEEQKDATQYYPFLVTCTCPFQGRAVDKAEADRIASNHLNAHALENARG